MLDASPNDMQSHNVLTSLGGNICYAVVVVYSNASVRKTQQTWLIFLLWLCFFFHFNS